MHLKIYTSPDQVDGVPFARGREILGVFVIPTRQTHTRWVYDGLKTACLTLAIGGVLAICTTAHAVTWDNGAPSNNWTDANNWDPDTPGGPMNNGGSADVVIPDGFLVLYDKAGDSEVTGFSLGNNATLRLNTPGANLTVDETADLAGIIDAQGGNFTATDDPTTNATFDGTRARIFANNGSVVDIDVLAYSSAGLGFSTTIMSADGVGTELDLSSVVSINTGFNDSSSTTREHVITATNGGTINLSGLETVTAPARGEDRLRFRLSDSDSTIDLAGLKTISGAGGRSSFTLSGGATLSLPALETAQDVHFTLSGGAKLQANGIPPIAYSSSGIPFSATLMSADGIGTVLDLSSVASLDAGFNDSSSQTRIHTIAATNGGKIDLSGLETVSAPARSEDFLRFSLSDAGSTIDLSGLHTIDGGSRSQFLVSGNAQLSLPALETAQDVHFTLSGGAKLQANGIPPIAYSSSGIPFSATLMSADGIGTVLDLSSVASLDAGFNDSSSQTRIHTIAATNGGKIDLSGLETVSAPVRSEDFLRFSLSDAGSTIDLSGLHTIDGGSRSQFLVSGNAQLSLPALETAQDVHFTLSGGAKLQANGIPPIAYSSSGIPFSATLMSADGIGTVLDLSSVASLDAGFNDSSSQTRIHTIAATNGGKIDLSGLETVSAPARSEDFLRFSLSDAGSTIDLSGLHTIDGGSRSQFLVSGNAQLSLPALETAQDVHFTLSGGAKLQANGIPPIAYSSSGIPFSATLMSADGIGTVLDLSSVASLDAGFNDSSSQTRIHTIAATNGGKIDLSGLETVSAPARSEDFLRFSLSDAGSTIDLSGLHTIDGGSRSQFLVSGNAQLSLPALETAQDVHFTLSGGAKLQANGIPPIAYSSSGIPFSATLMSADGIGTVLDLSSVASLDAGFNDSSSQTRIHTIAATNGGKIDLSGLETVSAPARSEDFLRFSLSDAGSTIDLSGLHTIDGGSRSQFLVSGNAQLSLPALETAQDVHFTLSGGAKLQANGIPPIAYSSSGIPFSATLMSADGIGTVLDLSSVRDAGFNDSSSRPASTRSPRDLRASMSGRTGFFGSR